MYWLKSTNKLMSMLPAGMYKFKKSDIGLIHLCSIDAKGELYSLQAGGSEKDVLIGYLKYLKACEEKDAYNRAMFQVNDDGSVYLIK